MAPRASFAPFYLRGPIKDWTDEARNGNSGEARLAGRKRYFARFPAPRLASAEADIVAALSGLNNTTSPDTQSRLRLLKPAAPNGELVFSGIIRLHNVTAEEIGALLWTLTHGGEARKPYRHMIGRAKNVGAGQARVKSLRMKLTAHAGKASKENLLTTAPETGNQRVLTAVGRQRMASRWDRSCANLKNTCGSKTRVGRRSTIYWSSLALATQMPVKNFGPLICRRRMTSASFAGL